MRHDSAAVGGDEQRDAARVRGDVYTVPVDATRSATPRRRETDLPARAARVSPPSALYVEPFPGTGVPRRRRIARSMAIARTSNENVKGGGSDVQPRRLPRLGAIVRDEDALNVPAYMVSALPRGCAASAVASRAALAARASSSAMVVLAEDASDRARGASAADRDRTGRRRARTTPAARSRCRRRCARCRHPERPRGSVRPRPRAIWPCAVEAGRIEFGAASRERNTPRLVPTHTAPSAASAASADTPCLRPAPPARASEV